MTDWYPSLSVVQVEKTQTSSRMWWLTGIPHCLLYRWRSPRPMACPTTPRISGKSPRVHSSWSARLVTVSLARCGKDCGTTPHLLPSRLSNQVTALNIEHRWNQFWVLLNCISNIFWSVSVSLSGMYGLSTSLHCWIFKPMYLQHGMCMSLYPQHLEYLCPCISNIGNICGYVSVKHEASVSMCQQHIECLYETSVSMYWQYIECCYGASVFIYQQQRMLLWSVCVHLSATENIVMVCLCSCISNIENIVMVCLCQCISNIENVVMVCLCPCISNIENVVMECLCQCISNIENVVVVCLCPCISNIENVVMVCLCPYISNRECCYGVSVSMYQQQRMLLWSVCVHVSATLRMLLWCVCVHVSATLRMLLWRVYVHVSATYAGMNVSSGCLARQPVGNRTEHTRVTQTATLPLQLKLNIDILGSLLFLVFTVAWSFFWYEQSVFIKSRNFFLCFSFLFV